MGKNVKVVPPKENQNNRPLSNDVCRDLRTRKLCFTCQESWALEHRCALGKEHYIEVFSKDEEEEEEETERGHNTGIAREDPPPP